MISFLRGKYAGIDGDKAVIDVNGIGFAVGMSMRSLSRMPEKGRTTQVYTLMQVREDDMSLYGFLSEDERELFTRLVSVSGVGPKMALAALSAFDSSSLIRAILHEDAGLLAQVPGVGKKTASRIILELKGALEKSMSSIPEATLPISAPVNYEAGVTEALLSMGFTSQEVKAALAGAPEGADETKLLQYALKHIGSIG